MNHERWWLGLILVLHVILTTWYSLQIPLGEAPDEADHWAYVLFLARERRLPTEPTLTQSKHPPLYHATAALVASLAVPNVGVLDTRWYLRANPDVTFMPERALSGAYSLNSFIHTRYEAWPWRPGPLAFRLARLWSVVLSTFTVWAAYHALRHAFPQRPEVVWLGTLMTAFLPEFAFIGGVVNNDVAAALFGTLALWGGTVAYRRGRLRAGWWTPLALGGGVWAKVSTLALWPAVGWLAWLGRARQGPRGTRAAAHSAGEVLTAYLLPAAVIASPWFVRNWLAYGDPFGWQLVRQTVDVRTGPWTWGDTWWLLQGWFVSFWGKFGSAGHIPLPSSVYVFLGIASVVALGGLVKQVVQAPPDERWVLLGWSGAILGVMGAIWRYSLVALGTNQGRLLFPALVPLLGLWSYGMAGWFPARQRFRLVFFWGGVMAVLAFYGLVGVIRPAYAPPPSAHRLWPATALMPPIQFGEIQLIGADLTTQPVLYWSTSTRPQQDWRVVLRITAEDGTLVWEWKRSPGAGRWSTDHWPPGYVMRDVYEVQWPVWAKPGRYRVEVAAFPFMGSWVIPMREGKPVATPEHPFVLIGWLSYP